MSARREKRLRKLEAKVAYMDSRVRSIELRQLEQEEMYFGTVTAPNDDPQPNPPRCSFWRRLIDSISGRTKPNE